jgi:DNA invertase Pin-like site-specific DNA recombinase
MSVKPDEAHGQWGVGQRDLHKRGGRALMIPSLGVDTTTPSGEMIVDVTATFAQFERRLVRRRNKL